MEAAIPEKTINQGVIPDRRLLLVCSLFGLFFSIMVTNQDIGLNFFLLVLAIYGAGIAALGVKNGRSFKENAYAYLLTVPVVLLSLVFALFSNGLAFLDLPVVLLLVWAQFMLFTGKSAHDWFDIRFAVDFFMTLIMRFAGCFYRYFPHACGFLFARGQGRLSSAAKVFIGVLVGLAALLIILPLLISADENMRKELDFLFKNINLGDAFLYVFFFLFAASLSFGFLWSLKNDKPGVYSTRIPPVEKKPFHILSIVSALTVVAAVYIFFAALQFKYLFSNYSTLMNTPGLTSSQYAVRGFTELMVISFLNFGFLALSMKFTRMEGKGKTAYIKILYLLLIAFNFIILISSHLRLSLYEHSFGYTVARFMPHVFLILIAAFNVVMLVKVLKPELRAWKYMLLVFVVFFTAVNYIGIDAAVARLNIGRYYEKGQGAVIDEDYLLDLPDDAMPVVADFLERQKDNPEIFKVYQPPENAGDERYLDRAKMAIVRRGGEVYVNYMPLKGKIERYKAMNSKWQSFNASRQNAQAAWERIEKVLLEKKPMDIPAAGVNTAR
jgi:hypothetical protein